MIGALLSLAICLQTQQDNAIWTRTNLPMQPNSPSKLAMVSRQNALDPPRFSPKKFGEDKIQWEFDWIVDGFVQADLISPKDLIRFRVYSQEHNDKLPKVSRMLLRLWDLNFQNLRLDHSPDFHQGLVDVFLCFGGKAGGEQLFDEDIVPDPKSPDDRSKDRIYKANTIYIYDLASFTDPVEMAREVAHEYGHATLPPVGGYKAPEDWSDGYLGEKLYLRWMRDALAAGTLTPDDTMGADKAGLDKWIAANIDPLVVKASKNAPTPEAMADRSAEGMDNFIGLALYLDTIMPDLVFARSLKMIGASADAKDYPAAILLAVDEPDQIKLKIPPYLAGKTIWIPLGQGKIFGTKVLSQKNGWVQIQANPGPIVITNKH